MPHYPGNLEIIKEYFKDRINTITIHETQHIENKGEKFAVAKNELLCIKTLNGRLKLVFGFNKNITMAIKKMPYHYWDAKNKWWTIPYSEILQNTLKQTVEAENWTWKYADEKPNKTSKNQNQQPLIFLIIKPYPSFIF